jgi:hypothetical protein
VSALWSVAVAQPLFQALAPNATFFLYHRATWGDVVIVALALCLPAYGLFWAVEWATARVGPRCALGCRVALLAALAALLWIQPLKRAPLERSWIVPLAWGLAVASAAAYLRFAAVRRWLALLSAATPVFVALFLLSPEIRALAAGGREGVAPPAGLAVDGANVVLVVFDGLPLATLLDQASGIDRDLFPNFARLADTSHWFRNASTVASVTNLALPAILTGNSAIGLGAANLAKYPNNLFTLLDGTYREEVDEQVTKLAPRSAFDAERGAGSAALIPILEDLLILYRHLVTVDPVAANLPTVADNWGGFARRGLRRARVMTADEEVPDDLRGRKFERFIASIQRRDEAQLYFHHTLLTHKTYRYLPSGRVYRVPVPTADRLGMWWVDEGSAAPRNYLRHVLQVQYADALLGRMLDRLEAEGLLEGSIVVVCADHGQTFWPDGGSRLELATVAHPDDILRVPLFIKAPGQSVGTIDDRNVDLRDVTPAVADLLGIELPWATEGHSPFAPDFPARAGKRLIDEHGADIAFGGGFSPDPETRALLSRYTSPEYDWRRLYRTGPRPELVGRRLEELETVEMGFSFALDEAAELADLDPRSETWPVRLSGTVDFPDAPPTAVLALALNGRIETTLQLRFREGRALFSGFVAEEAILGGRNSVEVLLVDGESGVVGRASRSGGRG